MKAKWILFFVITLVIGSLGTTPIKANDDSEIWSTKTTNSAKKTWTISFNQPVHTKSATSKTIFVVNEHNQVHATTLSISEDGLQVTVSPNATYQLNHEYRLIIDRTVRSTSSKDLKKNLIMPFKVVPKSSSSTAGSDSTSPSGSATNPSGDGQSSSNHDDTESLLQITVSRNDYVADVTVKGDDTITQVLIGRNKMHYAGNNSFNLGVAGVESGDTLVIKAYNHEQKLVAQERYKVE
ncbi:Ig-like domain-containing protein [Bacillus salitolerans]|uniref:Ig-like domain-containing protein n=1 Tax=Bacillus salitolerans TaxID=1437434 RepID=A0ABW4LP21_9BACI